MFFQKKPHINTDEQKIEQFLTRGVEAVFPNKAFIQSKMKKGESLTLYLGIDPTGPTLHIGHLVPIRKLSEFQKLGHQIIFLVGDFTATIGDPDKTSVRKPLTRDEVLSNLKEYKKQASRFIDFTGANKALFRFNSEWLSKMNFKDVLDLAALMTVDQMLKRDMFKKRIAEEKPIHIHEFMYPLMQGYDSVALDVDGEVGGNDQTFNMLAGRDLLKQIKNKEKFVIAMKLLTDPTGKKMGKSEGNMVALNQTPEDMFGKVMSWSDGMIVPAFEIVTDVSIDTLQDIKHKLVGGENPKNLKIKLASEIVTLCFGEKESEQARHAFEQTFSKGEVPEDIEEVSGGKAWIDVAIEQSLVESKGEFRRLIEGGAVSEMTTGEKITDPNTVAVTGVYKIGKRRFIKII
ncbi:MAG: tyrosine--tRNA ligase [Candidatus Zambryskibacteria bacterium]|nr:tyrosine--tRNA ligase [Candidatus Zambryskibacteria bacterium]